MEIVDWMLLVGAQLVPAFSGEKGRLDYGVGLDRLLVRNACVALARRGSSIHPFPCNGGKQALKTRLYGGPYLRGIMNHHSS
jgi:hypothetical protein